VGSPGFLAPEQVRGAAVTPATDIFALGATLAYACTADSPFGQGSSEVMLYRVVHEEAHLDGVPDALAPLLASCLAKDPADRPSTLSLSLRLKEIAARETHGLSDGGGAEGGVRPRADRTTPADRPTGKRADEYARQRTERGPAGTPAPRAAAPRPSGPRTPTSRASAPSHSPASAHSPSNPSSGANSRSGGRPSGRTPTGRNGSRPPVRTTSGGRRPAGPDRRLLRQRIIVFVTVTLLVALGIAAAQGCQGPTRGLGGERPAPVAPVVTDSLNTTDSTDSVGILDADGA
jgi:serine/threonine protein kinase